MRDVKCRVQFDNLVFILFIWPWCNIWFNSEAYAQPGIFSLVFLQCNLSTNSGCQWTSTTWPGQTSFLSVIYRFILGVTGRPNYSLLECLISTNCLSVDVQNFASFLSFIYQLFCLSLDIEIVSCQNGRDINLFCTCRDVACSVGSDCSCSILFSHLICYTFNVAFSKLD